MPRSLLFAKASLSSSGGGTRPDSDSSADITDVFLVDDHPAIRDVLTSRVNERAGMRVVGGSPSAEEALPLIQEHSPEVVVTDISLEEVDGLTLTRRIRNQAPDVRVLVFSMYDETVYAERAIRAGASGYLMKTEPPQQVVRAIAKVAEGRVSVGASIRSRILEKVIRNGSAPPDSEVETLTSREMTVFHLLGDGNSVAEIADHLNLSRKTVETYRRRAKEKLDCKSVDHLLQFAVLWTQNQAEA